MFKSVLLATALFSSSAALSATDAELASNGKLVVHAGIQHPGAQKKPTAYGAIYQDGTAQSGSGNFSAVWNGSAGWYEITIAGVNYYYLSHATTITTSTPAGAVCQSDSVSGKLLVLCYTLGGQPTQATFGFITY